MNQLTRKTLATVLGLALLIGASACGGADGSDGDDGSENSSGTYPVEIGKCNVYESDEKNTLIYCDSYRQASKEGIERVRETMSQTNCPSKEGTWTSGDANCSTGGDYVGTCDEGDDSNIKAARYYYEPHPGSTSRLKQLCEEDEGNNWRVE